MIRAFIALEIPESIQQVLRELRLNLQAEMKGVPLRWVPIENIHLTLKFFGNITEGDVQKITDFLRSHFEIGSPIEISLGGLGVFPNSRRPNVVWVGVKAPPSLAELQARLESELEELGYPREPRPFSPHLTLARARREARPAEQQRVGVLVAAAQPPASTAAVIECLTLFRSELKPSGSVYNPLTRISFSAS